MMKLHSFINGFVGFFIGTLIIRVILIYFDFNTNPEFYATNPLYTELPTHGIGVAVIIVIALLIKFFVKKSMKECKEETQEA